MSKRAPANIASVARGKITERVYDLHCDNCGVDYVWNNQEGESHLVDFEIELPTGDIAVEVESKHIYYEKFYVPKGMDFQAVKVEKYVGRTPAVWYAMVIYDDDPHDKYEYMYTLPMDTIFNEYKKPKGKYKGKYEKYTKRGIREWFYQVPLEECIKTYLIL